MSEIDRKRIAGVRFLEAAGHLFDGRDWHAPPAPSALPGLVGLMDDADAMHALLVLRADALAGALEGTEACTELERIADTVARYEAKRWPDGKVDGGKG
jgi:hypothetical protein